MPNGFTITATHDSGTRVLNPINDVPVFTHAVPQNGLYPRRTMETPLELTGGDFDYILGIEQGADRCEDISLDFERGAFNFYARADLSSLSVDEDNCRVQLRVEPTDPASCLLENWEEEFNVLSFQPNDVRMYEGEIELNTRTFTATPSIEPPPAPTVDPTDPAWRLLEIDASFALSTWAGTVTWVRQTITVDCDGSSPVPPPTAGWSLRVDNCPTNATYTKQAPRQVDTTRAWEQTDIRDKRYYIVPGFNGENVQVISGARRLNQVLEDYVDGLCGISVVSDFLGINPDDTAPSNTAYAAAPQYRNIMIWQRSDITRANAAQDATIGLTTLKQILEDLQSALRLFWFFDGGDLRIEHESYRSIANGDDLTTYKLTGPRKSYTRISADFPRFQKFTFDETYQDQDFTGLDLEYLNSCSTNAEQFGVRFSTDIGSVLADPSIASSQGFMWAACSFDGTDYFLPTVPSALSGAEKLNAAMGWPNLQANLMTFERPFLTGRRNGANVTFDSAKPTRRQILTVQMCPEDYQALDFTKRFQTAYGWGRADRATYSYQTQTLTIETLQA